MEFGLIGRAEGYPLRAAIHARVARTNGAPYQYGLMELPPEELGPFLVRREFRGVNVAGPCERAALSFLDEIDPQAAAAGAVNAIVNRDGRLCGYNTELVGARALCERMGLEMAGKTVLVLGSGGGARAAMAAAASLGAARVASAGCDEARERFGDAEFLIHTLPDAALDLSAFSRLEGVVDTACEPLSGDLVLAARERGVRAEGGLYLRAVDALESARLFLGLPWSEARARGLWRDLVRERENLVLIGMPGSGKSSVGRELAAYLGREFIDLDDRVAEREGRSIPEIFDRMGESCFRDLETACVRETAGRHGLVIATGGGCVLRGENVRLLKRNGVLIFLDRAPSQLVPTDDRPLANTPERIERLYRERHPLYAAAADLTIDYYAPAELPRPLARVAEVIGDILRSRYGGADR